MSQLTALKAATTLSDVADLLGFKPSLLSYNLYIKSPATKYNTFTIPKSHGGTRTICAPLKALKLIQKELSDLLQDCLQEIEKANGKSDDDLHPDRITQGFKRNRTIMTNATEHRNREYVFNVDITDFFGSINFGRVRGFFLKDKSFSLHAKVATVLAQIACYENKLPQGSPCSPVISNLITHILDIHLVQLASSEGCTYTRYADDLTFSTNKRIFPSSIAKRINVGSDKWTPGKELARIIKKNGFALNAVKTRMQYRDSRQEVTGLVVNRKVNVSKEYRDTVRAMVHRLFTTGAYTFEYKVKDPKGVITITKVPGTTDELRGMLAFVDQVEHYDREIHKKSIPAHPINNGRERLYRRFLFFDTFYDSKLPVIICEGKTDNVYIVHAIRSLVTHYSKLAEKDKSSAIKLKVRIFKYFEKSTGRILGMHGGVSGLENFIKQYSSDVLRKFKAAGGAQPIIVLIDNDSGANQIYAATAKINGNSKPTGTEPFIHVISNLYVVPTPLKPGGAASMIEDMFDTATLTTVVDGKLFDPTEKKDKSTHVGKAVFAHKVVRKNAEKIDFSGFKPILTNVVAVIEEHMKKHSASLVSIAPSK